MKQSFLWDGRVLAWFSCGAASACAAKLAVTKYGERCEVLYCDTLAFEHPDNPRFLADVSRWIGKEIKILKSPTYSDIFDVFDKTGWLVGPAGARCTTELKKNVRKNYQHPEDIHIFGLTSEEDNRIARLEAENFELSCEWNLRDVGMNKDDCLRMVADAGIDLPIMYKLGYQNNNCIGCVKGGKGYWNKIRKDFPEAFNRMALQERKMDVKICKDMFLDELDPNAGRYGNEPSFDCGVLCSTEPIS